jgi:hypothetical protein
MRAVLFEGTPEEFAKVEAMFRAGGDRTLQTRSVVLPHSRPKAWPELDERRQSAQTLICARHVVSL